MRLVNSFDKEVGFENLEEARKYYLPVEKMPCEEDEYIGDTTFKEYCELFAQYRKEIMEADTLEDLADTLNNYTDVFGNGSLYGVVR